MVLFQKKKNYKFYIALLIIVTLLIQGPLTTKIEVSYDGISAASPQLSGQISGTKQWLNNTGFDNSDDWYKETNTDQLFPDVNASIGNGLTNFTVLGYQDTFNIDEVADSESWFFVKNLDNSSLPDNFEIREGAGWWASHHWGEDENQTVQIQWAKNFSTDIILSDYNITSASLGVYFNASVHADDGDGDYNNSELPGGIDRPGDDNPTPTQISTGDYVKFFIRLSDRERDKDYEVASYRSTDLGRDDAGTMDEITDTEFIVDDMEQLIFYLNRVLEKDKQNFTITLGIRIFCQDNYQRDRDTWDNLYLLNFSLQFTYEKAINLNTYVSLNQDGYNVNSLSPYPVVANGANLKFQYKIDKNWSVYTPKENSEINMYLNGNPYAIPIKLIDVNDTAYEWADIELTPPASDEGVNLSIEVLIRDEFGLDQPINISIDDVTLDISYTIFAPDPASSGGGGGGGTKIIRGEDYSWLVYTLTAGIIGLVVAVTAYEKHYKYPPMVRKIRKLKKKIRKGRKVKSLLVNSREQLIRDSFKTKTHHILEADAIQPELIDKLEKGGT